MLAASSAKVGDSIEAYPISVAWEASDLSQLRNIHNLMSSHSSSRSSQISPIASYTNDPELGSDSRTSTTAAAGIGVGVTLGVVVLLMALLWFLKRYKKGRRSLREGHTSGEKSALQKMELEFPDDIATPVLRPPENSFEYNNDQPSEADSRARAELEHQNQPSEADSRVRWELE